MSQAQLSYQPREREDSEAAMPAMARQSIPLLKVRVRELEPKPGQYFRCYCLFACWFGFVKQCAIHRHGVYAPF